MGPGRFCVFRYVPILLVRAGWWVHWLTVDSAIMGISLANNNYFPSFMTRLGCLSCTLDEVGLGRG